MKDRKNVPNRRLKVSKYQQIFVLLKFSKEKILLEK